MKLTRKEFEVIVIEALNKLPDEFLKRLDNVEIVVEDLPAPDLVRDLGLRSPFELMGLYQGIPFDRRGFYYGNVIPDKITLFQRSLERACKGVDEIRQRIAEVVMHEIGHYFGLSEERLREIEG